MVWVAGALTAVLVSLMSMRLRGASGKVHSQVQGEQKGGQGGLRLPRCKRGQELGDKGGRGASQREEEADWTPSPRPFLLQI